MSYSNSDGYRQIVMSGVQVFLAGGYQRLLDFATVLSNRWSESNNFCDNFINNVMSEVIRRDGGMIITLRPRAPEPPTPRPNMNPNSIPLARAAQAA